MLHKFFEEGHWFLPKSHGYGAGMPVAWQGWVLLVAYILVATGFALWGGIDEDPAMAALAAFGFLMSTLLFLLIVRRRTKGGWRWRQGEAD